MNHNSTDKGRDAITRPKDTANICSAVLKKRPPMARAKRGTVDLLGNSDRNRWNAYTE
jgi:hypothetical protein